MREAKCFLLYLRLYCFAYTWDRVLHFFFRFSLNFDVAVLDNIEFCCSLYSIFEDVGFSC